MVISVMSLDFFSFKVKYTAFVVFVQFETKISYVREKGKDFFFKCHTFLEFKIKYQ